jgi:hypothetical protein
MGPSHPGNAWARTVVGLVSHPRDGARNTKKKTLKRTTSSSRATSSHCCGSKRRSPCVGTQVGLWRAHGALLDKIGRAVPACFNRLAARQLLVGCCRNCCRIAPATPTAARRLRLASQAWLKTIGLDLACDFSIHDIEIAVSANPEQSRQQSESYLQMNRYLRWCPAMSPTHSIATLRKQA